MKYLLLAVTACACGPLNCETVKVDIYAVDGKPKEAGKVQVKCDNKLVLEANGDNVSSGSK